MYRKTRSGMYNEYCLSKGDLLNRWLTLSHLIQGFPHNYKNKTIIKNNKQLLACKLMPTNDWKSRPTFLSNNNK